MLELPTFTFLFFVIHVTNLRFAYLSQREYEIDELNKKMLKEQKQHQEEIGKRFEEVNN